MENKKTNLSRYELVASWLIGSALNIHNLRILTLAHCLLTESLSFFKIQLQ